MVATAQRLRVPLQARAVRTRAALVSAGLHEFSKRGYARTTVRTIAKRAGVAVGTFYQYFTDKDDLLHEVFADRVQRLSERTVGLFERDLPITQGPRVVADAVRDLMRQTVLAMLEGYREDVGLRLVLAERRHADPQLNEQMKLIEVEIIERLTEVLKRTAFPGDAKATAYVLACTVLGTIHPHVVGPTVVSDARLVDALVDTLMRVAMPLAPHAEPSRREAT